MRNITLSVDDEVLRRARRYAAERETTVNAMVRDYLTRITDFEDRAAKARQRLLELAAASEAEIGPPCWRRDELHER